MRYLIDINHPGHVHFFKNFIWEAQKKNHEVIITSSDKDVALDLLNKYKLTYYNLGKYGKSVVSKIINIPFKNLALLKIALREKPDLFLGIASFRVAQVAWLLGKKSFIFDDTEHSTKEIALYKPFASSIFNPDSFTLNLGSKQEKYKGSHELAYLHPSRFMPDERVLEELNLDIQEKIFVFRFVSWEAGHDIGYKGFSLETKIKMIENLSQHGRVLITSEGKLPQSLLKYQISVSPEKIHSVLYYASLYIGEGATMAMEAAILGTPSLYINPLKLGYLNEMIDKYKIVFQPNESEIVLLLEKFISEGFDKKIYKSASSQFIAESIDVTGFILEKAQV
jgi:predicted glycosyltransferase